MPWEITDTMDQKIKLIAEYKSRNLNITELSGKYRISRPTVYKWIERYENQGVDGLKEQSRRPLRNPSQTKEDIIQLIILEKLKNSKRGPKKIYFQLKKQYPHIKWPSPSTMGHWLNRYNLTRKRKKRLRTPPYTEPFQMCKSANDVWSADYKGQFYMRNGKVCYPVTISDNYSRYLIKCQGLPGPRYLETKAVFENAFQEYGLPKALRIDNGTPFAGRCLGGLSRLSIWWIKLGIIPERIDKGCPQQNGRHERMHRTLKDEAITDVKVYSMQEQQKYFDQFCDDYNNNRPHEALGQQSPINYYQRSKRIYKNNPVIPDYDLSFTVRKVRTSGDIIFKGHNYFLTELLHGQPIGLKEVADGKWALYYSFYKLGILDLRKQKIIK